MERNSDQFVEKLRQCALQLQSLVRDVEERIEVLRAKEQVQEVVWEYSENRKLEDELTKLSIGWRKRSI